MIDAILTNTVLPQISRDLLTFIIDGVTIEAIELSVDEEDIVYEYS